MEATPGLEPGSWRAAPKRRPDAGAATEPEDGPAGEADEPEDCYCLCGERFGTPLLRAAHWETVASDGRQHGMPPDERKRIGVAWLLLDEHDGRVLRAGCLRLAATSEADDYSTKTEGQAVREAARDVLPGVPPGWSLRTQTGRHARGLATSRWAWSIRRGDTRRDGSRST